VFSYGSLVLECEYCKHKSAVGQTVSLDTHFEVNVDKEKISVSKKWGKQKRIITVWVLDSDQGYTVVYTVMNYSTSERWETS
jgi:hypothetical protein